VIDGILPVDKPVGWSSHDVVARVRRLAQQRQVGHAGTLDPLATGVLVLVLGAATRLSSYLMDAPKSYCADIVFGVTTATDDAEGPAQEQRDISHLKRVDVERCLERFKGPIDQVPPMYAAIRHGGERLYRLARKGVDVQPKARRVTVYELEIEEWLLPRVRLRVRCGSGTYLRALARDLGIALGVGGYLHALRRVASGAFTAPACVAMDALSDKQSVKRAVVPPDHALLDRPAVVLSAHEARAVRMGQSIRLSAMEAPSPPAPFQPGTPPQARVTHASGWRKGEVRLYGASGTLIALARLSNGLVKPFRVFVGGSELDADGL
jgi:tRNA pseudouridine55 synthase